MGLSDVGKDAGALSREEAIASLLPPLSPDIASQIEHSPDC